MRIAMAGEVAEKSSKQADKCAATGFFEIGAFCRFSMNASHVYSPQLRGVSVTNRKKCIQWGG